MKKTLITFLTFFILFSCQNIETRNVSKSINKDELESRLDYYYNVNLYDQVLGVVDSLIGIDNKNGSYYYKKAISLAFFKVYDSSNYYFLKSASLNYRVKDSYYCVALRFHYDKNDSLCLKYLNKALALDSNDSLIIKKMKEIEQEMILHSKVKENNAKLNKSI
jgi:tetratricopeptide (TPR) repeat protein